MGKYVVKRILLAIVTAFIILSITFFLVKILPFPKPQTTDLAQQNAYYQQQVELGYVISSTKTLNGYGDWLFKYQPDGEKITTYYYVKPVIEQYFNFLGNIFTRWDWGVSNAIEPNVDVMVVILSRLPNTIKINIVSVLISVPCGILLGILAALKKNTLTDHIISTSIMVFISIPSFIIIVLLLYVFAYQLKWLPSRWPEPTHPLGYRISGYVIPVMALSFGSICGYCRFTRAELCEVMASDYLLLARTKGLTKKQSITRHALRNAMVPIFPSILAEVVGLLGGSMVLERLYSIPGIGDLYITAINQSKPDYNVLFADMALFTLISLCAGVIVDISYGFIDPRIRMGAKK